jgi:phosphatidate cytidylyltransferase
VSLEVHETPAPLPLADVPPRPPTPAPPAARRWRPSNLTLRWLTALLLVPPVIWVCRQGGALFVAVVVLFNVVGVNEFYNFIVAKGANPARGLGIIGAAAIPLIVWIGDAFYATSFLTAMLLTTMLLQLTKRELHQAIASVSATFFGIFYVGWLFSHAVSVRFIARDLEYRYGASAAVDPQVGFFFMMIALAGALGCDAGAYFVGRRYGRRKLAPAISPNKTVEGAVGGPLVAGFAAALIKLVFDWLVPGDLARGFSVGTAFLFGVILGAAAVLGDLVESVLKRDAKLKEAGHILPGVGGVLDRIDSALLAFPVMYYLLLAYYYLHRGG